MKGGRNARGSAESGIRRFVVVVGVVVEVEVGVVVVVEVGVGVEVVVEVVVVVEVEVVVVVVVEVEVEVGVEVVVEVGVGVVVEVEVEFLADCFLPLTRPADRFGRAFSLEVRTMSKESESESGYLRGLATAEKIGAVIREVLGYELVLVIGIDNDTMRANLFATDEAAAARADEVCARIVLALRAGDFHDGA